MTTATAKAPATTPAVANDAAEAAEAARWPKLTALLAEGRADSPENLKKKYDEENELVEALAEHFKDEQKKYVTFKASKGLRSRLAALAEHTGIPVSELLGPILDLALTENIFIGLIEAKAFDSRSYTPPWR